MSPEIDFAPYRDALNVHEVLAIAGLSRFEADETDHVLLCFESDTRAAMMRLSWPDGVPVCVHPGEPVLEVAPCGETDAMLERARFDLNIPVLALRAVVIYAPAEEMAAIKQALSDWREQAWDECFRAV